MEFMVACVTGFAITGMSFWFVLTIIRTGMEHKITLEKIRHGYPLDERHESRGARRALPDDYDYAAPAARLQ